MSILKSIFNKIFPSAFADDSKASAPRSTSSQDTSSQVTKDATLAPSTSNASASAASNTNINAGINEVNVEKILADLASKSNQPSNWRTSIVDLLKLLDLDSSLQARKELAQELNYTGDMENSAAMNIWLHKEVMNKLAANGGKVPADLKD